MKISSLNISDCIQLALAFITTLAVFASLYISYKDRKNAQFIARNDMRLSVLFDRLNRLQKIQEVLLESRGNSIYMDTSNIVIVGEELLPKMYHMNVLGDYSLFGSESTNYQQEEEEIKTAIDITKCEINKLVSD